MIWVARAVVLLVLCAAVCFAVGVYQHVKARHAAQRGDAAFSIWFSGWLALADAVLIVVASTLNALTGWPA